MTTAVTTSGYRAMCVGDRVRFAGDTNRMRCKVSEIGSNVSFDTVLFVRPSKGYARHVRRMKQERAK